MRREEIEEVVACRMVLPAVPGETGRPGTPSVLGICGLEYRNPFPFRTIEKGGPVRHTDGSAGDADYGRIGTGYGGYRRPEPRTAARILGALGDARTVLSVGAGAGSYEPRYRSVTALEPSATMREQRPPELSVAVEAVAEALPDCRVVIMQGQGHAAMDTATELFAEEVLGFLGRDP